TLVFVDLIWRGQTTVKRQDIYRAQQERLRPFEDNEAAVESEVKELARRAVLFRRIVRPDTETHPQVRATLQRLDRWGASTTYPLVMYLFDLWDRDQCSADEVVQALSYV